MTFTLGFTRLLSFEHIFIYVFAWYVIPNKDVKIRVFMIIITLMRKLKTLLNSVEKNANAANILTVCG